MPFIRRTEDAPDARTPLGMLEDETGDLSAKKRRGAVRRGSAVMLSCKFQFTNAYKEW